MQGEKINAGTSVTQSVSMEHKHTYVTRCDGGPYISLSIWEILKGGKESVNDRRLKIEENGHQVKSLRRQVSLGP